MEFEGVIKIRNEIGQVFDSARQVLLAAQNASLVARRAGKARGFQAVVDELKRFSRALEEIMRCMEVEIMGVVEDVSIGYRERRYAELHEKAHAHLDNHQTEILAMIRERLLELDRSLAAKVENLGQQLLQSVRLCNTGYALARSARLEAITGGEYEGILGIAAHDIENTIEDIHVRLKSIVKRLEKGRKKA